MKLPLLTLFASSLAFAQAEAPVAQPVVEPAPASVEPAPTAAAPVPQPVPEAEQKLAPTPAKEEAWYDRVKLSGKTYLRYSWDLASSSNFNEFAIDRIYLQSE